MMLCLLLTLRWFRLNNICQFQNTQLFGTFVPNQKEIVLLIMAVNQVDFIYFASTVRNRINKDNYHEF